ncbi:hypothetical protein QQP08_022325 [Theobroma cacao]|nr:hypothetical protein QQP08_022325 [Theobroma cacao]
MMVLETHLGITPEMGPIKDPTKQFMPSRQSSPVAKTLTKPPAPGPALLLLVRTPFQTKTKLNSSTKIVR